MNILEYGEIGVVELSRRQDIIKSTKTLRNV